MSDVVGTAYVRIKALTDQLAKDIKKEFEKGKTGSDLDKAAESKGQDMGDKMGDGLVDSSGKKIKKRSHDALGGDALENEMDKVLKGFSGKLDDFDPDMDFGIKEAIADAKRNFNDLDFGFDFGDADSDSENFFGRLMSRFKSSDDESERWTSRIKSRFKSLGDDINRDNSLGNSLDTLEKKLKNFGKDSGPNLGFLGKSIGLIGGAIVAALPYIQDVGAALVAYATGLTAQIGFLTTALAGFGAAAGAAVGSAALAVLPIMLAFKAESDTLLDFKDSLAAAGEEFLKIGTATQQTLLPSLDDAIFILEDLVPMFSEFGLFVGQLAGSYARYAAEVLVSETAQGRFGDIMQSSLRILDRLFPTLINVGNILSGIWVAALPAAERFVDAIGDMVDRWSGLVTEGLATGELTKTLDLWYNRAALVGSALSNLSGALFDILSVGANSADNVFVRFDEWAERFRTWTESEVGQNKLALIFDNALAVMHEINAIAADLFDGILGRLTEVGGVDSMVEALQRFRDVIPEIQEAWAGAYDQIKRIVEIIGANVWEKAKDAWEELAEPLGRLADQTVRLLEVMDDSGAFELFLDLMRILTDILSTLFAIPGFGTFVGYFIALNGALKVSKIVLGPAVGALGSLVGVIRSLLTLNTIGAGAAGVSGIFSRIAAGAKAVTDAKSAKALSDVSGATKTAIQNSKGLAGPISSISSGLSTLGPYGIAAGVGVAAVGAAFFKHQQDAQRWRQEIRQITEDLGLLNEGLHITADGITKYIKESSRFESHDQIDDLERMGFTVESLAESVAHGTLSYREFADAALEAGEIKIQIGSGRIATGSDEALKSFEALQEEMKLTDEQMSDLVETGYTYNDGVQITLQGNDSVRESFVELNRGIAQSVNDNIDAFARNEQNIRLLGADKLKEMRDRIKSGDTDVEEDIRLQVELDNMLSESARKHAGEIKGLTEATTDQIREQSRRADGTIDWVMQEQLMTDALAKQNEMILENLRLFNSTDFEAEFGAAKAAVEEFSALTQTTDFSALYMGIGDNVDALMDKFPKLGNSSLFLFDQLSRLPADEFNAAATRMGVDAETLRAGMEGAMGAIKELQDQAVASLPTVGQLLQDATTVDDEGKQQFNKDGFLKSVTERIDQTKQFAEDIATIKKDSGEEAARLAAQQGPEAARNLAKLSGTDGPALDAALQAMETAETQLRDQIKSTLGPGIAAEYAVSSGLIGDAWGGGIAANINSPEVLTAIQTNSMDIINGLAKGFQGHFIFVDGKALRFVYTGEFPPIKRKRPNLLDRGLFATGGLVPGSVRDTFSRAVGTDTVPAMLTPGEFVNTRATVDRLGVDFFRALDRGATPAVPVGGGGIDASGWTIVSPDPYESSQQIIARLRTASFMLGDA